MSDCLQQQIALTMLPEIGDLTAKKLIAYCGSVEAVFKENAKALRQIPNLSKAAIDSLRTKSFFKEAEAEVEFIKREGITPLFYLDADYPNRLKHCGDSPILLYHKGKVNYNAKQVLAVVGTRQPTDHGVDACNQIIASFQGTDTLIISGLAYGIDATAHKAAMKHSLATTGVLGHSLDRIYPSSHKNMALQMLQNGSLLTEFKKGTLPDRPNFPMRNRIVAGLADATLVIESKESGGSLITANLAFGYNRDVFAIPGRMDDLFSAGCNRLIQRQVAQLILSAQDIIKAMNWNTQARISAPQKQLFVELTSDEQKVLDLMSFNQEISMDALSVEAELSTSKTSSLLLNLEFKGLVKTLPGKQYRRIG